MTYFEDKLRAYRSIHRHPVNRVLHSIGIPLIQFSVLGLLGLAHGSWPLLNGATLLIVFAFFVVARHSLRSAVAQTALAIGLSYLASLFADGRTVLGAAEVFGSCFVAGWMIQFTGHAFERKAPQLVRTPFNLLIGPLFVLDEVFRVLPDGAREGQK